MSVHWLFNCYGYEITIIIKENAFGNSGLRYTYEKSALIKMCNYGSRLLDAFDYVFYK